MKRPNFFVIISFLLILSALSTVGTILVKLREGDPGLAILVTVGVIEGVLSLVAAAGVFGVKRWGIWLAIILSILGIFSALSGITLWDGWSKGFTIVGGTLDVLVLMLAVLPSARRSTAPEQVREVS